MEASPSTNTYNAHSGVTMGIDALGLAEDNQAEAAGGTAPSQQTTSYTRETNDSNVISHPLDQNYSEPCQNEKPQSPRSPDFLSPKESRRVSFPLDSTVVSGYMDPPNPWQDASTCTTEKLIASYKEACEKHNVKPLPKLLNQLMIITNFCDRNETFTLKGEKLDARHCETLEEILRRVQFRTIDIENTHLDDESAVTLFDMVEYYQSCTRLNISHNKGIGIRGWQSCARLVKKMPCIDCLDARNCNLTEQAMPMLGRALRMGSQLTTLHLENAILSGRPLMILVTAIKMNEILRELYLADNKLMPSDGIQLGNMLKYNHKLQLLDIRNNHLQDVGTSHLCDGLFEQKLGQGLNTLVLWNNQVTFQSMPSLARALVNTLNLETLNLGHNNITNEGVHRLKEGLLINKSLLRIGLQAAKISCEGAVALAEFIADSPRLLRVDLRENDTKTGGLMALSLALKVSQTVTRIDLDKDPKRESGVKDYADQQRRLLQDIKNLMMRNREITRQREAEAELEREAEAEAAQFELEAAEARLEEQKLQEEAEEGEQKEGEGAEDLQDIKAVAKASIQAEEVDVDIGPEVVREEEVESGRPPIRQLLLEIPSRIQTLESPGFVTEAQLPIMSPPSAEEVASEIAAINAAIVTTDIPIEFPPSPMSPNKSIFTALQEEAAMKGASPTARRKFIISKVVEEEVEEEVEAGPSAAPTEPEEILREEESPVMEILTASLSPVVTTDPNEAGAEIPEAACPQEHPATNGSTSCADPTVPDLPEVSSENTQSNGASGAVATDGMAVTTEGEGCSSEVIAEDIKVEMVESKESLVTEPTTLKTIEKQDTDIVSKALPAGDAVIPAPNFHTNLSLNGMKVELATVLDTLEKTDGPTTLEEVLKAKALSVEATD